MSRSPFFRPASGDPFWDMFASERFFDSHFGSNLTEDDFFPSSMMSPYFFRRRTPFGAPPRSPMMAPPGVAPDAAAANPLASTQAATMQSTAAGAPMVSATGAAPPQAMGGPLAAASDPSKYQIMVDVSHFTPEEITVKTVDNTIVVIGKHEDKADNYGYVSRQFSRKYLLPADVEPETVTSTLSADGILSIQAPRKLLQIKDTDGRAVPIAISNQCISPGVNLAAPQFPGFVGQAAAAGTPAAPAAPDAVPVPVSAEATAEAPAQPQ